MKSVDTALAALRTRYRRRERDWLEATLPKGPGSVGPGTDAGTCPCAGADASPGVVAGTGTIAGAIPNTGAGVGTGAIAGVGRGSAGAGSNASASAAVGLGATAAEDRTEWPLQLPLGVPDERGALEEGERFRRWQHEWRDWGGPGEVRYVSRRWSRLGHQALPTHLVLPDAGAVAEAIGEGARWRRLRRRVGELHDASPDRRASIGALLATLDALDEQDWPRWRAAADWLVAHPASGLYPRQLPIAGVDTKALERWRASLERWLHGTRTAHASPAERREEDGVDALGLRRPPTRVRVRALDPALTGWPTGLTDVELPVAELAALPLRPARVLVVENLQSGLALPPLSGTLAVIGLGYAIEVLERLPWLESARVDYWGDIDTHGLAILARVRARFDDVRALLMDRTTLLAHRALWVEEPAQHAADSLDALTADEAALYDDLKRGLWGTNVRLEQERLAWPAVLSALVRARPSE